jgi:anti-anti-sigma factor
MLITAMLVLYPMRACLHSDVGAPTRNRSSPPRRLTVPRMNFEVGEAELRDAPGVAVRGEVDLSVVPELELALETAIMESVGAFVIDLSTLDFIDSSGLQVLLRARGLLGRSDRALAVVCPHGPVRRVFELSGLSDLFALFPSREAALEALISPQPQARQD